MLAASAATTCNLRDMARRLMGHRRLDDATEIIERVADLFGIPDRVLTGECRAAEIVFPREIAMYLLRKRGWSYPRIGRVVGYRHHSTAMNAVRKIQSRRQRNSELDALLKELEARP